MLKLLGYAAFFYFCLLYLHYILLIVRLAGILVYGFTTDCTYVVYHHKIEYINSLGCEMANLATKAKTLNHYKFGVNKNLTIGL